MSKNENLLPVLRDPQLKKYLIHKLAPKLIKAQKGEKKKKKKTLRVFTGVIQHKTIKKLFPKSTSKAINLWQIFKRRVYNSGSHRQRSTCLYVPHSALGFQLRLTFYVK